MSEPVLHFHRIPKTPVCFAWQRSSDGKWEIGGKVYRFCVRVVRKDEMRALNVIFFGTTIWFGWTA